MRPAVEGRRPEIAKTRGTVQRVENNKMRQHPQALAKVCRRHIRDGLIVLEASSQLTPSALLIAKPFTQWNPPGYHPSCCCR